MNRRNFIKNTVSTLLAIPVVGTIFVFCLICGCDNKGYNQLPSPKFDTGTKVFCPIDPQKRIGMVSQCFVIAGFEEEWSISKDQDGHWDRKSEHYTYEVRFSKPSPVYSNIENLNILNSQASSSSKSSLLGGKSSSSNTNENDNEHLFILEKFHEYELEKAENIEK